jgi:hypothetical protein
MTTRTYQIERVSGPDSQGRWTIECVAPLSSVALNETKIPAPSPMTLASDITAAATNWQITDGSDAEASGIFRIDDELIRYTLSGSTVTATERGAEGTVAASHSSGVTVQQCLDLTGLFLDQALSAILQAAGLASSRLDLSGWADERSAWLSDYTVTQGVLSDPRKAIDWVNSIGRCFNVFLWDDPENELIRMRALHPEVTAVTTIGGYDIIGKASDQIDDTERVSSTDIRVGLYSPVEDDEDQSKYSLHILGVTLGVGDGKHQFEKNRLILSRWHTVAQSVQARLVAQTVTDHLQDGRHTYRFEVPTYVGDDLSLGQVVDLEESVFLDTEGAQETRRVMIVGREANGPGRSWTITAEASVYDRLRYAIFMSDAAGDYASTSEEDRRFAGFFCGDDDLINGDDPYRFT